MSHNEDTIKEFELLAGTYTIKQLIEHIGLNLEVYDLQEFQFTGRSFDNPFQEVELQQTAKQLDIVHTQVTGTAVYRINIL